LFLFVRRPVELNEGLRDGEIVGRMRRTFQLPAKVLSHRGDILAIAPIVQCARRRHQANIEHAKIPRPARRLRLDALEFPVATFFMAARICFECKAGERSLASGPGSAG